MKSIQTNFVPETAAAFEAFNAALDSIAVDRKAVEAEREAIVSDALSNTSKTAMLRKRLAVCVDRVLDADRAELVLLESELPKLHDLARRDWAAEAERHAAIEDERKAVLEAHASELGMDKVQRHRLIVEDKTRRNAADLARTARLMAQNPGVRTEDDKQRIEQLRAEIIRALG